jgi:predicted hotdog family 3-hydroxylacyl-ACP dehydratase
MLGGAFGAVIVIALVAGAIAVLPGWLRTVKRRPSTRDASVIAFRAERLRQGEGRQVSLNA